MKTFTLKSKDIKRDWYVIDAAGKPLGRVAAKVASVLMGKNKATWTRHIDDGDFVVVINADKAILTGRKAAVKNFFHYSGYQGGLRVTTYKQMMDTKPTFPLYQAVKGMLPKNNMSRRVIRKMTLVEGAEHNVKNVTLKPLEI
jgi:large subunit ribosomal protein L13